MKVFLMVLSISVLLSSCKQARFKELEKASNALESSTPVVQEPHILFLFMKAQKTDLGDVIRIESHRRVEGKLKSNFQFKRPLSEGIRYIFFDSEKERSDTFWQEHPLHKHIEVADEEGKLQSRTIELDEAEVSLRIAGQSWYRLLVIEGIQHNSPIQTLTTKPYEL